MKRAFLFQLFTLLCICFFTAASAQSLYTIELQHRSASSIIPLIEPLLEDKEAVSGQNSLVILKTSQARQKELSKLIQQLDKPVKQLLIEVKSPSTFASHGKKQQTNVVISNRGNSKIVHNTRKTTRTRSNDPIHRIRVLDGHQASISDGKTIPLLSRSIRFGPSTFDTNAAQGNIAPQGYLEGIELSYHQVASTIYLRPRLHGNTVTLEITPDYSDLDHETNSGIQTRSSSTTVTIPLNQWSSLSGIQQENRQQSDNSFSTRKTNNETLVRVSVLPN